jgi:hypothetical protein
MCSVCKTPLCFKKARFPGQSKTCWDIFHTQKDLWYGECTTLCHVRNPRKDLGIDCTVKEAQTQHVTIDYANRKKRHLHDVVGYGGREMPRREANKPPRNKQPKKGRIDDRNVRNKEEAYNYKAPKNKRRQKGRHDDINDGNAEAIAHKPRNSTRRRRDDRNDGNEKTSVQNTRQSTRRMQATPKN